MIPTVFPFIGENTICFTSIILTALCGGPCIGAIRKPGILSNGNSCPVPWLLIPNMTVRAVSREVQWSMRGNIF